MSVRRWLLALAAALVVAAPAVAATVTKTWTFATTEEGFAAIVGGNSAAAYDSATGNPAGAIYTQISGKNKSNANYWEWSGTFEALGVPAGSAVTAVQLTGGFTRCTTYTTGAQSSAGPWELRDAAGTAVLATLYAGRTFSAADGSWVGATGSVTSLSNLPSSTTVRVRLNNSLATGNSNSAAVRLYDDQVQIQITYEPATTIGNGLTAEPGAATVAPGSGITDLDNFTLKTSSGTDTINSVTVTLAPAGAFDNLQTVSITNDAGGTSYGSATPSSNTVVVATSGLTATTTETQYHVRITPKSHAAMAAPPGASYATTGTVTAVTHSTTNALTYLDATSGTITVDNLSPGNAAWGTVTPGDGQVALAWSNPGDADFQQVIVLRATASIADLPVEGASYSAGNTIGASTVVYAGSGTSHTDSTVVNGTDYWYRIFARDLRGNYSATGAQTGPHRPQPSATTTVGNGTDPGPASRCPGGAAAELDAFTLRTSTGTDTVTAVTVDFANGTQEGVRQVEITDDSGVTVYGSTTTITDPLTLALGTNIGVTTAATPYRVRVTPKLHAEMPAPPGASYAVTGLVTGIVCANGKAYEDTTSATVTVDNASPGDASWGTITVGDNRLTLAWTNPGDADFAAVTILRQGSSITAAPSEGTTYTAGQTIGSASVVYAGPGASFEDNGVANGSSYYYKIFARDACVNHAIGAQTGPHQPSSQAVTTGLPTASASSCTQVTVSAPFTGDPDGDSRTTFEHGGSASGPWSAACSDVAGPSPRTCVDTVSESSSTWYRVTFSDPDGVLGANPQVTGPATTPACVAAETTAGTATAVAGGCHQITASAPLSGDGDGDGWVQVERNTSDSWPGTVVCARVTTPAVRACAVVGLLPSTAYWVRVTYNDPDGVTGTPVQVLGSVTTPACAGNEYPPTVLFLSPARNAVVGGTERFKVQIHDPDVVAAGAVEWSVDGGAFGTGASENAAYDCNLPSATGCKVFEFDVPTLGLANGVHYLTVRATDGASNAALASIGFVVNNSAGRARGGGKLLRRTPGSQLCIDCHNLPTHSSQGATPKYGNWAIECLACHTSHATTNLYLVRQTIATPNSGSKAIVFRADDRAGGSNPADSYLGASTAVYDDGVCEACHTRTNHYRNDTSGGDHTHNQGTRCVDCHQHTKAFAGADCNGCHNAPPTVGKHGTHDQVWDSTAGNTATSYTDTASHATATQYGFSCAKCHSGTHTDDTHAGTQADPYWVQVVFDATAPPASPSGSFAAGTAQTPDPGPSGDYWRWTDGTCSSTYCHSNAAPLGGTDLPRTVTWNQAAALNCASCHATQARSDSGTASDLSNAHGRHVQSTSGETGSYAFKCSECHAGTLVAAPHDPWLLDATDLADKTKHVDGLRSVGFSSAFAGAVDQSGGGYDGGGHTCSSTYCHSTGTSTAPPFGAQISIAWNASADAECDSCHGGNAAATVTTGAGPIATNGHGAHMNQGSYLGSNFMCFRCHSDTVVSAGDRAINTRSFHVNAARDVNPSNDTTTVWNGSTCASNYCHSSGQAAAVIQYYSTPAWSGGTLANDCKGCHGRHADNAFTPVAGEPNYNNAGANQPKSNSHRKHVAAAADCGDCHNDTSTTGTSIVAGSVRHLDGTRDVAIAAAWDNDADKYNNYVAGTKTCSNIDCHGTGTPQWGGTVTCLNCHGTTGAETNDLGATFWNNGTMATINTTEWTYSGHGKTSGSYDVSTNPAANLPTTGGTPGTAECRYCHEDSVAHKTATNPFRLRGASTDSSGVTGTWDTAAPNAPCLNCHATGSFGVTPSGQNLKNGTVKPDATHDGTKHTLATQGGKFCWDCHDPHGDRPSNTNSGGNNIFMIGRTVRKTQDGTYGYTGASGVERSVEFYNVTAATASDTGGSVVGRIVETTTALDANHLGICQACHDATASPSPATAWTRYWEAIGYDDPTGTPSSDRYRSGRATAPIGHNTTTYCISCHAHNQKFKGLGGGPNCRGCHGTQQQGGRRAVDADFADGTTPNFRSHHVGNSTTNVLRGTLNNFDCVVCHGEGTVIAGPTADCPTGTAGTTCTDPSFHTNGTIDLRNVDTYSGGASNVFVYDKDAVATSAGAPGNWNSGNQIWREWTSGVDESGGATLPANAGLDRFCISCHDADGASQIANFRESTGQTATNPFADTVSGAAGVTNNYDQANRGGVVDIASRVDVDARTAAGGTTTPADRDNGYAPSGVIVRGADGRNDPPEGVFSRHAIRGMSGSTYGATNANWDTATYWVGSWNSTSVMGCGDCHTVDGANGSSGNAHGSGSEYLLKDSAGLATEGLMGTRTVAGTYVCYACHAVSHYDVEGAAYGHTGNSGDFQEYVTSVGAARRPASSTGGNVYGYACGNCHGGGPPNKTGATFPTGSTGATGFGTIHGSSQVLGIASATGTARPAYRFTNGNSMRYYDPVDWTSSSGRSCYTIGAGDTWGGCTKHSGSAGNQNMTLSKQRPLNY
ncbi:MAG: CxxxxCH/CxxCH domain-containing protein [Thermoanaerobaculia bacterium]|nr:MAG: CxxxxCH/CxxCH domain-containing protein [Thermoanaerobaculia bacterium]